MREYNKTLTWKVRTNTFSTWIEELATTFEFEKFCVTDNILRCY